MERPETPMSLTLRLIYWFVVVNSTGAAIALILFPASTGRQFFWTITPPINAALLGGLYLVADLAVLIAALRGKWESSRYVVGMAVPLSVLVTLATFLHRDKFPSGPPLMYWLAVYIGFPLSAILLYWKQEQRSQVGWEVVGAPVRPATRAAAVLAGGFIGVVATFGMLAPGAVGPVWPWPLSPLMARVFAAWFAALAGSLLWFVRERDWRRVHLVPTWIILSNVAFLALVTVHRGDMKPDAALSQVAVYVALIAFALFGAMMHLLQRRR